MTRRSPVLYVSKGVLAALGRLPESALRRIAGPQEEIDGTTPHPEVAAALRLLNAAPGSTFEDLPLDRARRQIRDEAWVFGERTPVARVEDVTIPREGRPDLRVRRYEPREQGPARGLLVYAHGGGWVVGDLESADSACRFMADRADVAVVSVDYRLAPEHPFPAAVDDMYDAYAHVVAQAPAWGYDPDRVMVGGDSAGGNLAAVLSQQIRDKRRFGEIDLPPVAYALLFYPVTDLTQQRPSYEKFADGYFLTRKQMDWYTDHYAPDPATRHEAYCSPLLADDLSDLPPTFVGVSGFDPLRDEGIEYAHALEAAGNDVELFVEPRHIHGYVNATGVGSTSTAAFAHACDALVRHLDG